MPGESWFDQTADRRDGWSEFRSDVRTTRTGKAAW
jgi:hypothetical protein